MHPKTVVAISILSVMGMAGMIVLSEYNETYLHYEEPADAAHESDVAVSISVDDIPKQEASVTAPLKNHLLPLTERQLADYVKCEKTAGAFLLEKHPGICILPDGSKFRGPLG